MHIGAAFFHSNRFLLQMRGGEATLDQTAVYRGRFAPSPTGTPAFRLSGRRRGQLSRRSGRGRLVRMEDLDRLRKSQVLLLSCVPSRPSDSSGTVRYSGKAPALRPMPRPSNGYAMRD